MLLATRFQADINEAIHFLKLVKFQSLLVIVQLLEYFLAKSEMLRELNGGAYSKFCFNEIDYDFFLVLAEETVAKGL